MTKRILVTEELHPRGIAILEAAKNVEIVRINNVEHETLRYAVQDVDGVVVRSAILTADILELAPHFKSGGVTPWSWL